LIYSPGTEQFALLHPFHLVIDEQMVLRQMGPAIPQLVPGLRAGEPFANRFQVQRPRIQPTYDAVRAMQRAAFLLECLANGVILKGQMLVDEPRRMILFVGSPVIDDRTKLKEYGLTLSDFPMHDSTADLMELFSHFDSLIGEYGVEKIRTIGDNYMVVAPPASRPCPGPGAHGPGDVRVYPKPAALPKPTSGLQDGPQLGSGHRRRDRPQEIPV